MQKNVGGFDRTARLVAGPVLVAVGVAVAVGLFDVGLTGAAALGVAGLALVVGLVFLVTGTTQKCPANEIAGVDTYEDKN